MQTVGDEPAWYSLPMAFRFVAHILLVVLSAPLPLYGSGAGTGREAQPDSLAAHQRFDTVEPFLEEPDKAAKRAIATHCLTLDRRCLAFAETHGELLLSAIPDNPEFWAAYDSLLAAAPLPAELIEPDNLPAYQGFIEGANGWVRRELVTRRIADAERLHAEVMAHRRRLGLSNILVDKMVFTATTGILLSAVNVHMAQREVQESGSGPGLLDEMLQSLTPDEVSLRRVVEGERHYAAASLQQLPAGDSPMQLDDLDSLYGFIAERSQASWGDFWRHGLDILANVEVPPATYLYTTAWADYAVNVRYLEASLFVLRALREIYEGRISPGPPATPAPYGWSWRWAGESQTLCLDRGYVHASVSTAEPMSICHPYLMTSDSRPVPGSD